MILHVDVCCRCPLATPMYTNDVRAEICDANDMKPRDYGPLHSAKARTRLDPCSCSWYVASCWKLPQIRILSLTGGDTVDTFEQRAQIASPPRISCQRPRADRHYHRAPRALTKSRRAIARALRGCSQARAWPPCPPHEPAPSRRAPCRWVGGVVVRRGG